MNTKKQYFYLNKINFFLKFVLSTLILIFAFFIIYNFQQIKFQQKLDLINLRKNDEMLNLSGFSRREVLITMLEILAKTAPNTEILFVGNHQLQYFGSNFSGLVPPDEFFNLWLGNISLTETADVVTYLDEKKLLPKKALVIMITTPNNDNGNYIVGYSTELPDYIFGLHKNNIELNLFKLIDNKILKKLRYHLDYKSLLGFKNVNAVPLDFIGGGLNIHTNGSSANIYDDRGLVKNQSDISTNKSHINSKDIEDIRDAIVYISKVAKKNSIPLFVVIPPVHENLNRNSYANDILNIAIDFKFNNVNIIDHRKLILKTNPDYFKAFDHPNAKYGNYLYGKILSFMDN